jgi:hypothetical protein
MAKYVVFQDSGVESEPLSGSEILQWARDGRIKASSLIRSVGSSKWHRAKDVPAVAALLPSRKTVAIPLADEPISVVTPESNDDDNTYRITASAESDIVDVQQDEPTSEGDIEAQRALRKTLPPAQAPHSSPGTSAPVSKTPIRMPWGLLSALCYLGFAWLIFYFCGWEWIWSNRSAGCAAFMKFWLFKNPPLIELEGAGFVGVPGIVIAVNGQMYGMGIADRFFFSPVLQWLGFFSAWSLIFSALKALVGEKP